MIVSLTPAQAAAALTAGAVPLDVRAPADFAAGHLPGAINVPYSTRHLGERVATILPPAQTGPLLLVGPDAPAEVWDGIAAELQSAGFIAPAGALAGGSDAWAAAGRPLVTLDLLSHAALAAADPQPAVLDVREPFEWEGGVIAGAHRLSLGDLPAALAGGRLADLDPTQPVAVVCASGVRSSSAASLLRRHGYTQVTNLVEGMNSWYKQGRPVVTR